MIDPKKTISEAEKIVRNRILSAPAHTIFQSIEAQLDYIKGLREGKEKDKNRLKEINLGLYGVREFEESDPELSRILKELQFIVDEMRKGRKI